MYLADRQVFTKTVKYDDIFGLVALISGIIEIWKHFCNIISQQTLPFG